MLIVGKIYTSGTLIQFIVLKKNIYIRTKHFSLPNFRLSYSIITSSIFSFKGDCERTNELKKIVNGG